MAKIVVGQGSCGLAAGAGAVYTALEQKMNPQVGAERIIEAVQEELGIGDNQTTEDGLFSLSLVSCLGCCSLAPVMMINEDTYGSLTPDKVKAILRDIRAKEGK